MLRLTATALALVATFTLAPLGTSEAGAKDGYRAGKHQTFRMNGRDAERRHVRRVVAKAVTIVRIGGGKWHDRRSRQGNTYSGDVVIDVRNGVGQWSYGSLSSSVTTVRARSKAKIIDVSSLKANSACQMLAGVCLIKP